MDVSRSQSDGAVPERRDEVPAPWVPAAPVAGPPVDPLAVVAVTLGQLAILPGAGILAALCGFLALRRDSPERQGLAMSGRVGGFAASSRGVAITGIILGCVTTVLWLLAVAALWWLHSA